MAFFDQVGRKLSQAGQTAVQKTKDMTDVARINAIIAEEERKINNNYYQIGKLYVAMYAEKYEDEFIGMVSAIKESETKIRNYHQQIQDIKGVVHCNVCGAEVPNNSMFCNSCGAVMKGATKEKVHKCMKCGTVIDENQRFCTSCGQPVSESIQEKQIIQDTIEGQLDKDSEFLIRKCPKCSAELENDSVFCSECGTKI